MNKNELLSSLSKEMAEDKNFRLEVLEAIVGRARKIDHDVTETLKHMIRSNCIHYRNPGIINNKEEMVREINDYILERIAFCYIYDINQADHRIFDAISEFCSQVTKEQFQDLQFYAMMNFNVKLVDIFSLKEKLSDKLNMV